MSGGARAPWALALAAFLWAGCGGIFGSGGGPEGKPPMPVDRPGELRPTPTPIVLEEDTTEVTPAEEEAVRAPAPDTAPMPLADTIPPPPAEPEPAIREPDTARAVSDTAMAMARRLADTMPAVVEPPPPPPPAPAEETEPPPDLGPGTVGPGFTERQVRRVLGDPVYTSAYGEHTFYFYDNFREKQAGFLDFVIFRNGRVVDAVFRHPDHHYAGNSSSPRGVTPRPTPGGERLSVPPAPPPDTTPTPPPDEEPSPADATPPLR